MLPFYPSTLTAEEEDDIAAAMAEPSVEKLADVIIAIDNINSLILIDIHSLIYLET